jgi:polysaccharide deacetylase family sporulation protein PdaB
VKIYVVKKRTLIIVAAAVIGAILLIIGLIALATAKDNASETSALAYDEYEIELAAGANRELPVYSVERSDKKIALTIDAAWESDKTTEILADLEKENIKATFFLVGMWVDKYPEKVKMISDKGHEIGNHSDAHPHMNTLSAAQITDELKKMDDKLEAITGKRSTLFRAPYGEYNDNVIKAVRASGHEPIQWDVDTIDWKPERTTDMILSRVMKMTNAGSIILCHNNGYTIEDYLPKLISQLKNAGYEFVTVSELLLQGETTIDNNGRQQGAKKAT